MMNDVNMHHSSFMMMVLKYRQQCILMDTYIYKDRSCIEFFFNVNALCGTMEFHPEVEIY